MNLGCGHLFLPSPLANKRDSDGDVARIRCLKRAGRNAASGAPMTTSPPRRGCRKGRETRPVADYAKRTANVLGRGVRADLPGGGAVAVAVPAVCSDAGAEYMDALCGIRKDYQFVKRIESHQTVCNLGSEVYRRYIDIGRTPAPR